MKNGLRLFNEIVRDKEIVSCAPSGEDISADNTDFINVKVSNIKKLLDDAAASGVPYDISDMHEAILRFATQSSFTVTSIKANACHFIDCNLDGVYTANGTMRGCLFTGVYFNLMILEHIRFEGCKFERCSFSDMRFGCNEFVNCRFSHCILPTDNISFFYTLLKRCVGNTFSQCTGWPSPSEFLAQNFERNEANTGYIVYKTFGHLYTSPKEWMIIPGSIITENCDLNRMETCSYGINVATLEWIGDNINTAHGGINRDSKLPYSIWRCEILDEWLADVCVPIGSDGKIRCGKLRLIEPI